ncbi:hypothetical protein BDV09DRAFT_111663 [Aspergillus tetrazonus]
MPRCNNGVILGASGIGLAQCPPFHALDSGGRWIPDLWRDRGRVLSRLLKWILNRLNQVSSLPSHLVYEIRFGKLQVAQKTCVNGIIVEALLMRPCSVGVDRPRYRPKARQNLG